MHSPPDLKSRPLGRASSCGPNTENSLRTKSVSGCSRPIPTAALRRALPGPSLRSKLRLWMQELWGSSVMPDCPDVSGLQMRFDISPHPKPRCSSFPGWPAVSVRAPPFLHSQPQPGPHTAGWLPLHPSSSFLARLSRIVKQPPLQVQRWLVIARCKS